VAGQSARLRSRASLAQAPPGRIRRMAEPAWDKCPRRRQGQAGRLPSIRVWRGREPYRAGLREHPCAPGMSAFTPLSAAADAHGTENRVGGGLAAPVLPHHRTYLTYPAVPSAVSASACVFAGQGSCSVQRRRCLPLLERCRSGSAFSARAGAHALPIGSTCLAVAPHPSSIAVCSLLQKVRPFVSSC
jgi:hypothetical protein